MYVMSSALCGVINHISRQKKKKTPCRIGEEKDYYEYYKRESAHVRL